MGWTVWRKKKEGKSRGSGLAGLLAVGFVEEAGGFLLFLLGRFGVGGHACHQQRVRRGGLLGAREAGSLRGSRFPGEQVAASKTKRFPFRPKRRFGRSGT